MAAGEDSCRGATHPGGIPTRARRAAAKAAKTAGSEWMEAERAERAVKAVRVVMAPGTAEAVHGGTAEADGVAWAAVVMGTATQEAAVGTLARGEVPWEASSAVGVTALKGVAATVEGCSQSSSSLASRSGHSWPLRAPCSQTLRRGRNRRRSLRPPQSWLRSCRCSR